MVFNNFGANVVVNGSTVNFWLWDTAARPVTKMFLKRVEPLCPWCSQSFLLEQSLGEELRKQCKIAAECEVGI
ncbi:hypothetical protein V6N11_076522 [Hibiscus sabdariffa]|uniref:Uncharacterized protein n=1 Tax=Hibiscus sabdariffa TaxID=183260 RepID=A0ABR2Q6J9_9ROSI